MWNRTVFDFCPHFKKNYFICTQNQKIAHLKIAGSEVWACKNYWKQVSVFIKKSQKICISDDVFNWLISILECNFNNGSRIRIQ